jgi:gamma-glutamylcysteine synthetase
MRIDGAEAMIALEREASLRVEPGTRVELACLSGVVWITQQGDLRDRTLVTALEPSLVRIVDAGARPRTARAWWARAERLRALWARLRVRVTGAIEPRPAVTE